jgi:hypothetical protein
MSALENLINHDQEWLKSVIEFEAQVRHAEIKSLCNGKSICEMREILRLVLGKLKHINNEAIAAREVKG